MAAPDPHDTGTSPEAVAVGAAIRRRRRALGIPMVELAASAGLSQPFLSQLERGLATPSLSSIYRIAESLDCPPGALLRPRSGHGPIAHEPDPQTVRVADDGGQTAVVLIPGGQSAVMEAYRHTFVPGEPERGWFEHPGEDFLYVLEGEVVLELRGEEPLSLRAGQSAHHPGEIPHRCRPAGGSEARTLLVTSSGARP
ncbi:XRE family transcriptional regulator [Streptomyces sp. SP17BM10]|uniref:helix-turn-helix domain-containing protein n=1 Tax=Streptomyces sp. SP17BM10 TaxID=3002530 RepID=UPI002E799018|nr:XRE family transcriptional regulator [Streptomyces sp. SP17BM10]MEE1782134.1 XRE family transcriptional regulator [Streptomyces sp. SP17BM10]